MSVYIYICMYDVDIFRILYIDLFDIIVALVLFTLINILLTYCDYTHAHIVLLPLHLIISLFEFI